MAARQRRSFRIALPDVTLDDGGRPEGQLPGRAASLDWLEPVWHDAHWQLFEVHDYAPIVDAPATLVSQDVDQIVIETPRAAVVTIRYEYSDDLSINDGACLVRARRRLDDGPPPERRRVPATGDAQQGCRRRRRLPDVSRGRGRVRPRTPPGRRGSG